MCSTPLRFSREVLTSTLLFPDDRTDLMRAWVGQVFPDWFSENADSYWAEALTNWSQSAVNFSGIWLDMNEVSSFCNGSWCVQRIAGGVVSAD